MNDNIEVIEDSNLMVSEVKYEGRTVIVTAIFSDGFKLADVLEETVFGIQAAVRGPKGHMIAIWGKKESSSEAVEFKIFINTDESENDIKSRLLGGKRKPDKIFTETLPVGNEETRFVWHHCCELGKEAMHSLPQGKN